MSAFLFTHLSYLTFHVAYPKQGDSSHTIQRSFHRFSVVQIFIYKRPLVSRENSNTSTIVRIARNTVAKAKSVVSAPDICASAAHTQNSVSAMTDWRKQAST